MDSHSLSLACGVASLTLASPSTLVVLGVVGMVCVTTIAVTAIASSSKKKKEKKKSY